jgi:hypothetical protein
VQNINTDLLEKTALTILEEVLNFKTELTVVKNKIDSVQQVLSGIKDLVNKKVIENGVIKN